MVDKYTSRVTAIRVIICAHLCTIWEEKKRKIRYTLNKFVYLTRTAALNIMITPFSSIIDTKISHDLLAIVKKLVALWI